MFRIGDTIGPYTLISKLGQGAFGVVWLAERRTAITTTKVAIKLPLDSDIDISVIKQEADLWVQACGHPNVLPIIEADVYEGQVVIVSEYALDGSLEAWLKPSNGLAPSIQVAVDVTSGILAGLNHLHSRRIIHRDLKPANILLQGTMPRLADFGIARMLKSTAQSSAIAGTPAYMAPEAFDGKRFEQTDLWSVGVIFYQLLTGHLPFPQSDMMSLLRAILLSETEPLPPSIPKPLREFLGRSLLKDPTARFQTAMEMLRAIQSAYKSSEAFNARDEQNKTELVISNSSSSGSSQESTLTQYSNQAGPRLVYANKGAQLYDKPGGGLSQHCLAGTAFSYLGTDDKGWCLVKDDDGNDRCLQQFDVAKEDPRTFFRIKERGYTGYLVGNMYPDGSSGSLKHISLNDSLLGKVEIQIRRIKSIQVNAGDKESPLVVETFEGSKYAGTSGTTYLIGDATILLESAKGLTLARFDAKEKN